jgi:hypothetical protein
MARLYVMGARQRKLLLREEAEWNLYDTALILELDTDSGAVRTCVEYKSPAEARATETSSVVFKSGALAGDVLYACTSTEVLIFQLPDFKKIAYISLPCFNDLHHVVPASDGSLLAAVTGLDTVAKFTAQGKLLATWSVFPESPLSRFSPTTDYRKIESTKPHYSHPNFVFELNGEVWVTRFRQRDAFCLNDSGKRIDIAAQRPHDGVLRKDKIYFTLVDGRVVIANSGSLQVETIIDLKEIGPPALLGWCRGILPQDETLMWVGFSRIRRTRFYENVLWVKNVFREGMREAPTHIALYDIARKECLQEFDLEGHGMNIVFSIFLARPVQ